MRSRLLFKTSGIVTILLGLVCAGVLFTHNIDQTVTQEDRLYVQKILEEAGDIPENTGSSSGFEDQIKTIRTLQEAAFHTAPQKGLIPMNHPREPKDLYETQAAYCSDRARFMEKALKIYGFDVRFASLYEKKADGNILSTLLTKGNEGAHSHAIIEVKTQKGWLVVDSRTHWLSLTAGDEPVSLPMLQLMAQKGHWPFWSPTLKDDMFFLMKHDFYIFYGLYSRHGRFYSPYTPYIPDFDLPQLRLNFQQ